MNTNSIGFIGGGRITRIFLTSLHHNYNKKIVVSDPNKEVLNNLKHKFENVETTNENEYACRQDVVIIALHPPQISQVLDEIRDTIRNETIIISLAPKLKMKFISEKLNSHKNIVRSIPNSPSIIKKGFNPISFYYDFDANIKNEVFEIFENFGKYFETEENKLEAYAIITAMGPTYLQFQINKLVHLSKEFGLDENQSQLAVKNMVSGVSALLFDSNFSFDQVEELIPVKPMKDGEQIILNVYDEKLKPLYAKLCS